MQQREKILATLLLGTLGIGWAGPKAWNTVQGPVTERQTREKLLDKQLDSKQQELTIALAKLRNMKDWKGRSLPSDPQVAALAYQQWLTDLAEVVVRFSDLKVSAPTRMTSKKSKTYAAVRLTVSGQATLMQVREFLYRFARADVLHHVTDMKWDSQQNEGNPLLRVSVSVEGLALKEAPERGDTLFARTELKEDLQEDGTSLTVQATGDFPDTCPFRVRIGAEYVTVTETKGAVWTLQRHVDSSRSSAHSAGTVVESAPIHPAWKDRALDDYMAIVDLNPFAKPGLYDPRLEFEGNRTVQRGGPVQLQAKALGFGPKHGKPTFSLAGDVPTGLEIDTDTGQFQWNTPEDLSAQPYSVTVAVAAFGLEEPLSQTLDITLQEPNSPPALEPVGEQTAFLGQELVFAVQASDDNTPADQLKFSLADGAPEGTSIDATTGEFRWALPETQQPGPVVVTVQVADAGDPALTTTQAVTVAVQDDVAQYTYLTAAVAADTQRQAWLYDRANNKRLVLREGDSMKYAGMEAFVLAIGRDFVLLQKDDGSWRLGLGKNLRSAEKIAEAPSSNPQTDANDAESDEKSMPTADAAATKSDEKPEPRADAADTKGDEMPEPKADAAVDTKSDEKPEPEADAADTKADEKAEPKADATDTKSDEKSEPKPDTGDTKADEKAEPKADAAVDTKSDERPVPKADAADTKAGEKAERKADTGDTKSDENSEPQTDADDTESDDKSEPQTEGESPKPSGSAD